MKQNKAALAIAIALVVLAGCGKNAVSGDAATPASTDAGSNTVLTGSSKEHYKKPGAPVDLTYQSDKVIAGQASNISATFHLDGANIDSAKVDVVVDSGLVTTGLAGDSFFLDLKPDVFDYPLAFSAYSNEVGLRYVNMIVTITQRGETQSRAFSIPVQAGSATDIKMRKATSSPTQYDANQKLVIPMKAEETIK